MLFLGLGDIIAAGLLMSKAHDAVIPQAIVIFFAIYLLLKGLIFLMDIGSLFDLAGGILLILSLSTTLPAVLFLVVACLLGLKGVMSLFAKF